MAIEITRQALKDLQPKFGYFSRQGSFLFYISGEILRRLSVSLLDFRQKETPLRNFSSRVFF
jgi:hypothetical protein